MLQRLRQLLIRLRPASPAPFADEQGMALRLLHSDEVQRLYQSLGADPQAVLAQLERLPELPPSPHATGLLQAELDWERDPTLQILPLELHLLNRLLQTAPQPLVQALAPAPLPPGDLLFARAHGQTEAQRLASWPDPPAQTGQILLMNDPVTWMESVVQALGNVWQLPRNEAIKLMMQVHLQGSASLPPLSGLSPTASCQQLNARWREQGWVLYVQPQALAASLT